LKKIADNYFHFGISDNISVLSILFWRNCYIFKTISS